MLGGKLAHAIVAVNRRGIADGFGWIDRTPSQCDRSSTPGDLGKRDEIIHRRDLPEDHADAPTPSVATGRLALRCNLQGLTV